MLNHYIKESGSVSVCAYQRISVTYDLIWYFFELYFYRSCNNYFGEVFHHHPKRNCPQNQINHPQFFFLFLFRTEIERRWPEPTFSIFPFPHTLRTALLQKTNSRCCRCWSFVELVFCSNASRTSRGLYECSRFTENNVNNYSTIL